MSNSAKIISINDLQPAKRYNLFISASSDAGITEAEYDFYSNNSANYLYPINGLSKNANPHSQSIQSPSAQFLRQYMTILMPVAISILIIVTFFGAILFCFRKQNILFSSNHVEVSAFDRISCNSNINSKCDSGVGVGGGEGLPLSDYQCVPKLKSFEEDTPTLSYYSSPARKNSSGIQLNTTAIKSHSGTNNHHHDYAEPFIRLTANRHLPEQYGCDIVSQEDKIAYQQHYASIKKNKFIRPSNLIGNN